jgi:Hsp20/alpha crystallin family
MNHLDQPFRGATLQEQFNHMFGNGLRHNGEESNLTPWAPAVDIYETENELVVKADLPDVNPQDLDIRVENNILTIRGERKFDSKAHEDNECVECALACVSEGRMTNVMGETASLNQVRINKEGFIKRTACFQKIATY